MVAQEVKSLAGQTASGDLPTVGAIMTIGNGYLPYAQRGAQQEARDRLAQAGVRSGPRFFLETLLRQRHHSLPRDGTTRW